MSQAPVQQPVDVQTTPAHPVASNTSRSPYPRRRPVRLMRSMLIVCWAFILGVVSNGMTTLIGYIEQAPRFPPLGEILSAFLLPSWLLAHNAPLASRIAVPVAIVTLLPLCIWATADAAREGQHAHRSVTTSVVHDIIEKYVNILRALPPAPGVATPDRLPLPASLVGRDIELRDLMQQLAQGTSADVFAVEGMGGVGKTALAAVAVAQFLGDRATFPGGAVWVSCEGRTGTDGLAQIWADVARQLGQGQIAALPTAEERRTALAGTLAQVQRTLIALDNVEPGLDADMLITTLARPGHTVLLLTARQAVAPEKLTRKDLAPLPELDAETLFVQRLHQVDSKRPTQADKRIIPVVVEVLGGLPLAIELTAAYAGVQRMRLAQLVEELRDDGVNAQAFRQDPKRGPATRFERSWQVLTPCQQQLFAGLSLLEGATVSREAALAIALAAGGEEPASDLNALVTLALVEALPGGARLRLHPLLRTYASGKLAGLPAAEALGEAMVAHWLAYAESHPGDDGMDALEAEVPGLNGALEWAHAHGRDAAVADLCHSLRLFWRKRWHIRESLRYLPWGLEAADARAATTRTQTDVLRATHLALAYGQVLTDTAQLGETQQDGEAEQLLLRALASSRERMDRQSEEMALSTLGQLARQRGQWEAAAERYRQALAISKEAKDPQAQSTSLVGLGQVALVSGQWAAAAEYFHQALAIAEAITNLQATGVCLFNLGQVALFSGQREAAGEYYHQALAIAEQAKDHQTEVNCQFGLGEVALARMRLEEAEASFQHLLARMRAAQDLQGESVCLFRLGCVASLREHLDEAETYFRHALNIVETAVEDPASETLNLFQLGKIALKRGQLEAAEDLFQRACKVGLTMNDRHAEAMCLTALGQVAVKSGRLEAAEALLRQAFDIQQAMPDLQGKAITLLSLAETCEARGNLKEAGMLYQQSLDLARESHSGKETADALLALGRFLIERRNDYEAGCSLLTQAIQAYTEMGLPRAQGARELALRLGCAA